MELKPCPFCGCEHISIQEKRHELYETLYMPTCLSCLATAGQSTTKSRSVEAWNSRAVPSVFGMVPETEEGTYECPDMSLKASEDVDEAEADLRREERRRQIEDCGLRITYK